MKSDDLENFGKAGQAAQEAADKLSTPITPQHPQQLRRIPTGYSACKICGDEIFDIHMDRHVRKKHGGGINPEHAEALKALIDLAVSSNAQTSVVIARDDNGKIIRAAVVCEGNQAKLLVRLMREAQITDEK